MYSQFLSRLFVFTDTIVHTTIWTKIVLAAAFEMTFTFHVLIGQFVTTCVQDIYQ